MRILLHPGSRTSSDNLAVLYKEALAEATELFVVSAYLTDWNPGRELNPNCETLAFIVGVDFGITTKEACKNVLNWLPGGLKNDFMAADGLSGFHPKLVMWRKGSRKRRLLLGSSNLTLATFTTNYEANVCFAISEKEYGAIKHWVYTIIPHCSVISADWLVSYREVSRRPKSAAGRSPWVVEISQPTVEGIDEALSLRREQENAFEEIEAEFRKLIKRCATSKLPRQEFYRLMMSLWASHRSRFQSAGFERSGKQSNWEEVCQSLLLILAASDKFRKGDTASLAELDRLVKKEIDGLAKKRNPTRRAWFSEVLCQFLPDLYPLINQPVNAWLEHINYRPPKGASEGARYIDLAAKLRRAVENNTGNGAENFAELDHVIFWWHRNSLQV